MRPWLAMLISVSFTLMPFLSYAQENEQVVIEGRKYLELKTNALDKYARRIERSQKNLLHKLKRKEARLASKLLRTDSAAYARLKSQPLSFDSISKLAYQPDSIKLAAKPLKTSKKAIDSLKGVYQFLQNQAASLSGNKELSQIAGLSGYDQELNSLQGKLSYNEYISGLINRHGNSLEGIVGNNTAISGIQKELFYGKAKLAEWKKIAEDPSAAEEKALEYLRGTKGFDLSMNKRDNGNAEGVSNAASADDLEKMGFMTKKMMTNILQQKFGNSLQSVQGNVGKEIGAWQRQGKDLEGMVKETKHNLNALKETERPRFKINPMRGKLFFQRIEKQYSFNTSRATTLTGGAARPAILTLAASAAYKHTPKLSTGIGLAGEMGLGNSWSSIRFTFEGIGIRAFFSWEWQYGIGAYGGWERTWKNTVFGVKSEQNALAGNPSIHITSSYSDAALIGLSKKYKINSKWNGAIQVLYDLWASDKGLRSPIVLRFINSK